MATKLKREYDLLDLKVGLDTSGSEPTVVCELEATFQRETRRLNGWSFPLAFNLPSSIVPGRASSVASQFKLPEGFGDQLRTQLEQAERDVVGPLWLHLARPYGYLGLLPGSACSTHTSGCRS